MRPFTVIVVWSQTQHVVILFINEQAVTVSICDNFWQFVHETHLVCISFRLLFSRFRVHERFHLQSEVFVQT